MTKPSVHDVVFLLPVMCEKFTFNSKQLYGWTQTHEAHRMIPRTCEVTCMQISEKYGLFHIVVCWVFWHSSLLLEQKFRVYIKS